MMSQVDPKGVDLVSGTWETRALYLSEATSGPAWVPLEIANGDFSEKRQPISVASSESLILIVTRDGNVYSTRPINKVNSYNNINPVQRKQQHSKRAAHTLHKFAMDVLKVPKLVPHLFDISKVAIGCPTLGSKGLHHCAAVSRYGQLFMWGNGREGQLGTGYNVDVLHDPEPINSFLKSGEQECFFVRDVACGANFTVALITNGETMDSERHANPWLPGYRTPPRGEIYTFGSNSKGQLGCGELGGSQTFSNSAQHVILPENYHVFHVACGQEHSVVVATCVDSPVDDDKILPKVCPTRVFAWGSDELGQLGLGVQHSVVRIGNLASCCKGEKRSNDVYESCIFNTPQHVEGIPGVVVSVGCGAKHSVASTLEHGLFSWGDNRCGQLGIGQTLGGKEATQVRFPVHVPTSHDMHVVELQCGFTSTTAMTDQGKLYNWGKQFHSLSHKPPKQEIRVSQKQLATQHDTVSTRLAQTEGFNQEQKTKDVSSICWTPKLMRRKRTLGGMFPIAFSMGSNNMCAIVAKSPTPAQEQAKTHAYQAKALIVDQVQSRLLFPKPRKAGRRKILRRQNSMFEQKRHNQGLSQGHSFRSLPTEIIQKLQPIQQHLHDQKQDKQLTVEPRNSVTSWSYNSMTSMSHVPIATQPDNVTNKCVLLEIEEIKEHDSGSQESSTTGPMFAPLDITDLQYSLRSTIGSTVTQQSTSSSVETSSTKNTSTTSHSLSATHVFQQHRILRELHQRFEAQSKQDALRKMRATRELRLKLRQKRLDAKQAFKTVLFELKHKYQLLHKAASCIQTFVRSSLLGTSKYKRRLYRSRSRWIEQHRAAKATNSNTFNSKSRSGTTSHHYQLRALKQNSLRVERDTDASKMRSGLKHCGGKTNFLASVSKGSMYSKCIRRENLLNKNHTKQETHSKDNVRDTISNKPTTKKKSAQRLHGSHKASLIECEVSDNKSRKEMEDRRRTHARRMEMLRKRAFEIAQKKRESAAKSDPSQLVKQKLEQDKRILRDALATSIPQQTKNRQRSVESLYDWMERKKNDKIKEHAKQKQYQKQLSEVVDETIANKKERERIRRLKLRENAEKAKSLEDLRAEEIRKRQLELARKEVELWQQEKLDRRRMGREHIKKQKLNKKSFRRDDVMKNRKSAWGEVLMQNSPELKY